MNILIEPADNGVIKVAYDDSSNGAGEEFVSKRVYDFESDDEEKLSIINFLVDLVLDLGIEIGTDIDKYKVLVGREWGDPALQDQEEIKNKIKELQAEIKTLEKYLTK